jgi:hypothetical protein
MSPLTGRIKGGCQVLGMQGLKEFRISAKKGASKQCKGIFRTVEKIMATWIFPGGHILKILVI